MLVEWSDAYSVGIDDIDEQHQGIFQAAHRLYYAIINVEGEKVVDETLEFLQKYAAEHFQNEEAFMERHGYPRIEQHKKLHADFLERIDQVKEEYNVHLAPTQEMADSLLELTQDWLIDHIADVDSAYAEYVKRTAG